MIVVSRGVSAANQGMHSMRHGVSAANQGMNAASQGMMTIT